MAFHFFSPRFRDPSTVDAEGIVGVTRSMTVELLIEAYSKGIFPWTDRPVYWFSPDPRAVFELDSIHFPKRTMRLVRKKVFTVTFDQRFEEVVRGCRDHHADSWITEAFVATYGKLHRRGYAHSVEVWKEDRLVGGLYGVQVARTFAGESMFYKVADASKVGFVHLVEKLKQLGVTLFDAQVLTPHTERFGARNISRADFLSRLEIATSGPWVPKKWETPEEGKNGQE